ncbi:MAG: COX15/CtaA family protein [Chloroflexi bacterium]|nr:COX15/CtaA family protein [Chloroflexota bacterium]
MESEAESKGNRAVTGASGQRLGRLFPVMAGATLITALMAVVMGGIVRVTGSGLGCPDWPLCHGQIIPPWEIAPWIEYLHRLSASVSGVFTILMVVTAFMRYGTRSRTIYVVVVAAVLLVIQALLGAYTVLSEIRPAIALFHTGVATGLVGMLALIAAVAIRPRWLNEGISESKQLDSFRLLMVALGLAAFVLILSGAYVTRTDGAAFACTDIPLCGNSSGEMAVVQWIHMTHRVIGFLFGLLMLVALVKSTAVQHKGITVMMGIMTALLAVQIGLGIANVLLGLPTELQAAHLAVAVLYFAVTMLLIGTLWRSALADEGPTASTMKRRMAPSGGLQ